LLLLPTAVWLLESVWWLERSIPTAARRPFFQTRDKSVASATVGRSALLAVVVLKTLGLTKRLNRILDGFVGYRFVGTTDVSLDRTIPNPQLEFGDYKAEYNNVLFGLRIWR
jgi:hypothetical protein